MTDTSYDSFKIKLVTNKLIFDDAELSEYSRKMNDWRYQHFVGMAHVAADDNDEITIDGEFDVNKMLAKLSEALKLNDAGIFSLDDIFDALASHDTSYANAPTIDNGSLDVAGYRLSLETMVSQSQSERPWRVGQSAPDITKTAFPGAVAEIPRLDLSEE